MGYDAGVPEQFPRVKLYPLLVPLARFAPPDNATSAATLRA